MNKAIMLISAAILGLAAGCGGNAKTSGKWLDYGNGMVNLEGVSQIGYELTASAIGAAGYTSTSESLGLTSEAWKEEFKDNKVQVKASLMFDNFKLNVIDEEVDNFKQFDHNRRSLLEHYGKVGKYAASAKTYESLTSW